MTPEKADRAGRALFILTPFMFPFMWVITAIQGADTRACLIVSIAGTLMCFGAALLTNSAATRLSAMRHGFRPF